MINVTTLKQCVVQLLYNNRDHKLVVATNHDDIDVGEMQRDAEDRALNSHSFRVSLTHFNAISLSHSLTPQSHSFLNNLTQISLMFNNRARVW